MWILANYYLWSNGKTLVEETSPGEWKVAVTADDIATAMNYFNGYLRQRPRAREPDHHQCLGRSGTRRRPRARRLRHHLLPAADVPRGAGTVRAAAADGADPEGQREAHLAPRRPRARHQPQHQASEGGLGVRALSAWARRRSRPTTSTRRRSRCLRALDVPAAEQGYVEMLPLAQTFERYISSPIRVSTMTAVDQPRVRRGLFRASAQRRRRRRR